MEFIKDRIDDLNSCFFEPGDPKPLSIIRQAFGIHIYTNIVIIEKRNVNVVSPVWIGKNE